MAKTNREDAIRKELKEEELAKVRFVHQEVKENLKTILEAADKIDDKAFKILTIVVAVFNAVFGVLIAALLFGSKLPLIVVPLLIVYLIITGVSIYHLKKTVRPQEFDPLGNLPSNLLKESYYSKELIAFVRGEAKRCEDSINKNQRAVDDKMESLEKGISWLVVGQLGFVVVVGLYALFFLFFLTGIGPSGFSSSDDAIPRNSNVACEFKLATTASGSSLAVRSGC